MGPPASLEKLLPRPPGNHPTPPFLPYLLHSSPLLWWRPPIAGWGVPCDGPLDSPVSHRIPLGVMEMAGDDWSGKEFAGISASQSGESRAVGLVDPTRQSNIPIISPHLHGLGMVWRISKTKVGAGTEGNPNMPEIFLQVRSGWVHFQKWMGSGPLRCWWQISRMAG